MKINQKIKLVIISILAIPTIVLPTIYISNLDTKTINNNISLTIPSGASSKSIAKILKQNNMIKSESAFVYYVKKNNYATKLCSGKFYFSEGEQTFESIVNKLIKGGFDNSNTINVTIPEGYTVKQIAELLVYLQCFQ